MANMPFVGAGVLGSAVSMDKDVTKRLLRDAGLAVAPFVTLTRANRAGFTFEQLSERLGLPLFVKPANQGSSVGVSRWKTAPSSTRRYRWPSASITRCWWSQRSLAARSSARCWATTIRRPACAARSC